MYNEIAVIIALVLIATLQVFLCKRENRRIGLILPIMSLIVVTLAVIGISLYSSLPNLISQLFFAIRLFVFLNIPTLILAGIYILYHGRR
ncbi:MAG: hypothetical protein FWE54_06505 [Methanimicrococcus sp.]|nr:hypothetical protein [Methanimicrococcus sp.]